MVKVHVPVEFKESKIAKLTFLRVHKKCFLYLYLDSVSQSESANIPLILTMVKFSALFCDGNLANLMNACITSLT